MSKWGKILQGLRLGAALAIARGVKVKGVPLEVIVAAAEKDGARIADSVKTIKAARPKPVAVPPVPPSDE